ncbi:MAG TPA: hypothetical protein VGR69_04650 [Candidatus Rubrimentiphilum sp.]|nr:hypothetical protein [Candidatus Rubrimentiphilum sp.]
MRVLGIMLLAMLSLPAACTPDQTGQTVTIGRVSPWPLARAAAPKDPPRILAAEMSSDSVRQGEWWSGRVATTTNVAVVELRSPSFSFILERPSYGQFRFRTHVLVVPSIYRRGFDAALIARNAAGQEDRRVAHLSFR